MAALGDDGVELIEIAPLNRVQARGDIVQFGVFRCIGFDLRHAALGMLPPALKRGPIALAPETSELDTGLLPRPAAHQPDRMGCKLDAEDFANGGEIIVSAIPPIVIEVADPIPFAGAFLGGV
nr:hypothetical protein DBT41_14275 [Aerococcus urinae]